MQSVMAAGAASEPSKLIFKLRKADDADTGESTRRRVARAETQTPETGWPGEYGKSLLRRRGEYYGGSDGTRTPGLLRDRQAF